MNHFLFLPLMQHRPFRGFRSPPESQMLNVYNSDSEVTFLFFINYSWSLEALCANLYERQRLSNSSDSTWFMLSRWPCFEVTGFAFCLNRTQVLCPSLKSVPSKLDTKEIWSTPQQKYLLAWNRTQDHSTVAKCIQSLVGLAQNGTT